MERFNDGKNFTLAVDTDVLQFNKPVPRLQAIHVTDTPDWYLIFDPLDRDDIGNLTCERNENKKLRSTFSSLLAGRLTDTNLRDIYLTRFLNVISER